MRLDDFVEELKKAGWRDLYDAQHTGIEKLWQKLFPVLAQVELELFDAECRLDDLGKL